MAGKKIGRAGFLLVLVLLLSGCITIVTAPTPTVLATQKVVQKTKKETAPPASKPNSFFPAVAGTKWTYQITIGEAEPLYYREIEWPIGDGKALAYANRGRFPILLEENKPETFVLELQVKGPAEEQGILKYAGVEMEVLRDDLGVYEEAEQLFWAFTRSGTFIAHEVVTYPPDTLWAPTSSLGGSGQENGCSLKIIFFAGETGTTISMGKEPQDELTFMGIDTNVPGFTGQPLLHFLREVKPDEEPSEIGKGFTEDTWFALEKGMVYLVQKVEGVVSMTWKMTEFKKS